MLIDEGQGEDAGSTHTKAAVSDKEADRKVVLGSWHQLHSLLQAQAGR